MGIVGENEFEEKQEEARYRPKIGIQQMPPVARPSQGDRVQRPGMVQRKENCNLISGNSEKFLDKNNIKADIHVITGSVEIAPGIGLADAIFDIVSSGSTLISNNLKEVEVVMKSEALLIGNKNMSEEKKEILKELLFRLDAVKAAEDKKYVLMNVPTDKVKDIIEVLPGIKSPTVMPLATEGGAAYIRFSTRNVSGI